MIDTIKILADITKQEIKRSMGVNAHYSPRYGWHLRKNVHVLDNESNDDSTTNDEPSPFFKHANSTA